MGPVAAGAVDETARRRGARRVAPVLRDEPWPEVMTAEEAASYLRLSKEKLYVLIRGGEVPAARLGRDWRIRFVDLEALFTTQHDGTGFE